MDMISYASVPILIVFFVILPLTVLLSFAILLTHDVWDDELPAKEVTQMASKQVSEMDLDPIGPDASEGGE